MPVPHICMRVESPSLGSWVKLQSNCSSGNSSFSESITSLTVRTRAEMASLFLSEKSFMGLGLFRSAALVLFAHGLKFAVILRAFFGGCFTALATKGNGGWIFLCHARIVQKAVAVCKRELCINSNSFPPGFRVLCHNCNQALGAYGYCPHKGKQN